MGWRWKSDGVDIKEGGFIDHSTRGLRKTIQQITSFCVRRICRVAMDLEHRITSASRSSDPRSHEESGKAAPRSGGLQGPYQDTQAGKAMDVDRLRQFPIRRLDSGLDESSASNPNCLSLILYGPQISRDPRAFRSTAGAWEPEAAARSLRSSIRLHNCMGRPAGKS